MIAKIKQFCSKHTVLIIAIIATCFSVTSFLYFYLNDLTLIYNDSISHLNIARRVFDNLTPGLVQLGSVWLPFHHILMLPFIWNDFMWQSGIAGSIVSMLSYIIASIFLFLLVFRITNSYIGGIVTFSIFALNPNILYMQSIAMGELLLVMLFIISVYFLFKWFDNKSLIALLFSAFFVMLSTLVRYDGWFLLFTEVFLIFVYILVYQKNRGSAIGNTILFSMLGGFGVVLWLLYNKIIFGNWLYFLNGEYSASTQQKVFESMHLLTTKHNIILSSKVYLLDVMFNAGVFLSIFLLVLFLAVFIFLIRNKSKKIKIFFILILLFSPVIFNILTLFLGISILFLPNITAVNGYFNVRYGIMTIPLIAFFGGIALAQWNKKALGVIAIIIVIIQYYFMFSHNKIITLTDGLHGISTTNVNSVHKKFVQTIIDNYDDGFILIDVYTNNRAMFESKLPQKQFVHEGAGKFREDALKNPEKYITLIVISNSSEDILNKKFAKTSKLNKYFYKIFEDDKNIIYKNKISPIIKNWHKQ